MVKVATPRVTVEVSHAVRLFGVVDANEPHDDIPVPGTTLVAFRDLAAVVSPAEYTRMVINDDLLTEYVRVIDASYALGPVIPAPPGTVFQSAASLMHWMEVHYAKLHETLGVIERRKSPNAPYDIVRMQFGA